MSSMQQPKLPFFRRLGRKIRDRLRRQSRRAGDQERQALHQLTSLSSAQSSHVNDLTDQFEGMQVALQRLQLGVDALRLDLLSERDLATAQTSEAATAYQGISRRLDVLMQRSALITGNDALLHTPAGYLLVPTEDKTLLSAVWESSGRLEPGTVCVLVSVLREGDHVIDVGSHIGLTVLPAARKVGPSGRVLAFEPIARVAALLKQSMALNFMSDRVVVHQCAAGDVPGKARMHLAPILGESTLLDVRSTNTTEEEVDVCTVDSLVSPGQIVRLVKIDAEGFEPRVWKGMRRLVDDNPDLIVVVELGPLHLARAGISVEDWLSTFTALGFTPREIDELSGVIRPLRACALLRQVTSLNLLMLRQDPSNFPELEFE